MLEYIEREAFRKLLLNEASHLLKFQKNGEARGFIRASKSLEKFPTADVVPRAEVKALIAFMTFMKCLKKIIDNAKHHDLAALRPPRDASGFYAYQGAPPICRKFDEVFDKHAESIYAAIKFVELKKKYTEGGE